MNIDFHVQTSTWTFEQLTVRRHAACRRHPKSQSKRIFNPFIYPACFRVSQAQNIDVAPADTLQLNPQDPLLMNKRRQICFGLSLSSSFLVF